MGSLWMLCIAIFKSTTCHARRANGSPRWLLQPLEMFCSPLAPCNTYYGERQPLLVTQNLKSSRLAPALAWLHRRTTMMDGRQALGGRKLGNVRG